jgi:hypothetical protein
MIHYMTYSGTISASWLSPSVHRQRSKSSSMCIMESMMKNLTLDFKTIWLTEHMWDHLGNH